MVNFFKKKWELFILVVFIIIAGVLRFYHITRLEFFTYDQARDALFVKRMIVDHEFRLLGTQTSLPGMYLPPFYYYTIAVVLWLFKLNPVGIDIYSALIGVLTVPLIFLVANRIFGRPAGVFSSGLMAVSPLVVELTRRAWNPNTLPFFILVTFYFVFLYFKKRKTRDFLFAFGFYGYSLSLHFGSWTLLPLFAFICFFYLFKDRRIMIFLAAAGIILFFIFPLLMFELRHNFFLLAQAKTFFLDNGNIGMGKGNFIETLFSSVVALFTILISGRIIVGYGAPLEFSGKLRELFSLKEPISVVAQKPFSLSFQWWGILLFFIIVFCSLFYFLKSKKGKEEKNPISLALIIIWIWFFWGIFSSRFYSGNFFFFYYLFLFPAPILLFAFLLKELFRIKLIKPAVFFLFTLIIVFHLRNTTVFKQEWRDIIDLKAVARMISMNVSSDETFNIATIQKETDRWDRNSVDYRYFVETFGKRALDWYPEDYEKAEVLFVIDETGGTDVIKSKVMEIEKFRPGKIIGKWNGPKGIDVYKIEKRE